MKHSVIYTPLSAALLLALAACSPEGKAAFNANMKAAGQNAENVANNAGVVANKYANIAKDNVYKTSYQVQKWAATPPEAPKGPREIEQSYCYRSFHDVLCYRAPLPGAESRLVAYQGTYAEEPPPSVTQLLPTHPYDPSQLPENRIANAQPVFLGLPPPVKEDKNATLPADTPIENIPAPQPDPKIAPQL